MAGRMEAAATWEAIDSLTPWDRNPRRNDHAMMMVARSIERFGFGSPIIARTTDRVIIGGHTRYKAAKHLGMDKVPVRFLDLDPAEAAALALADNRLGELAEWDEHALSELIEEVDSSGIDVDLLGWTDAELDALIGGTHDSGYRQPDLKQAPDEVEQRGETGGDGERAPAQAIRMVQLYLTVPQEAELRSLCNGLAKVFGCDTVTDVVFACVKSSADAHGVTA